MDKIKLILDNSISFSLIIVSIGWAIGHIIEKFREEYEEEKENGNKTSNTI